LSWFSSAQSLPYRFVGDAYFGAWSFERASRQRTIHSSCDGSPRKQKWLEMEQMRSVCTFGPAFCGSNAVAGYRIDRR